MPFHRLIDGLRLVFKSLRRFIDRIVIPTDGLLQVVGNLDAMLAVANGEPLPNGAGGISGCGGSQRLLSPPISEGSVTSKLVHRFRLVPRTVGLCLMTN